MLGLALLLAGGVIGMMLAVELLGDLPPRAAAPSAARPAAEPRSGAEAPLPAPAQSQEQEARRMQLNAEVSALRQAVQAERARLEDTARRRAEAEAALAAAPPPPEQAEPPAPPPPPAASAPEPLRPSAPEVVPPPPPPPPRVAAARPEPTARPKPEPSRAEGRVVLHYLADSVAARQAAEDAASLLRDAGVEGVELRASTAVPGQRVVRYHRAEDAAQAARLAGRLGRGWAVQDSRGFDPGGVARGLELWLPDR